jgi:hypothetical protein
MSFTSGLSAVAESGPLPRFPYTVSSGESFEPATKGVICLL